MQPIGFRFELRLGKVPEDTVRVSVSNDTLQRSTVSTARRVLFDAAVDAFRARAVIAGHDRSAIEEEVTRFESAVGRRPA